MKIFTLKNRQSLMVMLLLSFLLAGAFSASAEEYKSMIRYDRVWEHIYINWGDTRAYHVRFAGTEEINGKTYHRLEAFREIRYTYDYDAKPKVLSINNDYYQHEGYMREEDGKVYTLVITDSSAKESHFAMLYTPEQQITEQDSIEERVIYDFTCKEGETYRGCQSDRSVVEEITYKIMSIDHVEIDGENHKTLHIRPDNGQDYVYGDPIVEGIGIASYGCLTTINFLRVPTCPCMNHVFNRILSTDGRVLYRTEDDCVELPYGDGLGIDAPTISSIEETAPCYDILGRRIADPAPGQLYIQGGKKHIAK
ncbi:MAG: hypothetical protein K2L00_03845 [Muribaculaceae bacterium]|nr:hypothetical protein [Muribaculaceae bacterium]